MSEFLNQILGTSVSIPETTPTVETTPEPTETPVVEAAPEVKTEVEAKPEVKVEAKPEVHQIPNPVALEWKREKKQLARQNQELQQRLEELEAKVKAADEPKIPDQPIVFDEPDPAEVYIQENNMDAETPLPYKVMKERDAWLAKKAQAEKAESDRQNSIKAKETSKVQSESERRQAAQTVYNELAAGALSEETLGDGLGLEDVHQAGSEYLTDADRQAIRVIGSKQGPDQMWRVYYQKCYRRAVESGSAEGLELQARARAVLESRKSPVTPTPEAKPKIEAPAPEQKPVVNTFPTLRRLGFDPAAFTS